MPKVCSGKLLVAADGSWYLPVHHEPAESWQTFAGSSFHPLSEAPEKQAQLAAPPGASAQVRGWEGAGRYSTNHQSMFGTDSCEDVGAALRCGGPLTCCVALLYNVPFFP